MMTEVVYLDKPALAKLCLKVVKALILVLDFILDIIFQYKITKGTKRERELSQNYESSAQIVDIYARAFYAIDINQPSNFLYVHNRYVHPDFILQNDNVIMMGITPTHAFFSITKSPENDLRNIKKMPFLFVTQCGFSDQLLMLPLSSFHRLADQLGDPNDRKICIIYMTGRCGSNLVCQMIDRVPNARVFSECYAFEHAQYFHRKGMFTLEQHNKNFQSIMRILCKPEHDTQISHLLIKMSPLTTQHLVLSRELFPNFLSIFMTRTPRCVILSWLKEFQSLPKSSVKTKHFCQFLLDNFPVPFDKSKQKWQTVLDDMKTWLVPEKLHLFSALLYAAPNDFFIQHKSSFDLYLVYDDLLKHPSLEMQKLFKLFDLDEKFIPDALKAMNEDSQKGTFGQRGHGGVIVTDAMWKDIDNLMNSCVDGLNTTISINQFKMILSR